MNGLEVKKLTAKKRDLLFDLKEITVNILYFCSPVTYACEGGVSWTKLPSMKEYFLTKEEYSEGGQPACIGFFDV